MKIFFAILLFMSALILITVITSCEKDFLVPEKVDIPDTVRFSVDIIPIFNANCNTSGCHSTGGYSPNLMEENAYINITAYGLIDADDPESSILYQRLISIAKPMPPEGNIPAARIEMILKWIRQGAYDN